MIRKINSAYGGLLVVWRYRYLSQAILDCQPRGVLDYYVARDEGAAIVAQMCGVNCWRKVTNDVGDVVS